MRVLSWPVVQDLYHVAVLDSQHGTGERPMDYSGFLRVFQRKKNSIALGCAFVEYGVLSVDFKRKAAVCRRESKEFKLQVRLPLRLLRLAVEQ